jgi:hypothetical protein
VSGRWVDAKGLRIWDVFVHANGKSVTVTGLVIRRERLAVYNLHVAGLHSYAVGRAGVAVHNTGPDGACLKVQHISERAAHRAAERSAGMGRHRARTPLESESYRPGSDSPTGLRGVRKRVESPETGLRVVHDELATRSP